MEKGTKSRVISYLTVFYVLGLLAFVFFLLTKQGSKYVIGGSFPNGLPYMLFLIILADVIGMFALIYSSSRNIISVYKEAVGKVFEIDKLSGKLDGISKFKGTKITITCSEELAVGDRVLVTGYDTHNAGRWKVYFLLGKKLSQDDPENSMADQDAAMSPIG